MRARARFHDFLKRLFARPGDELESATPIDTGVKAERQSDPTPLFSLGEDKQKLVASYRNLESEGA